MSDPTPTSVTATPIASQTGTASLLPARFTAAARVVRDRWGAIPRAVRVLAASTLLCLALIGSYVAYRAVNEPYGVLFSQLEREDAAALVAKLRELHIPYRLEADGTRITVPNDRVPDVRLELASAGLPRGGGVGFESFDHMRLGATEFEQHVLYRRALEGELARSIATISSIESARVHLVIPERSLFISRTEPASASVIVRLRGGRHVDGSEVGGIVHLVALSVPGLSPQRVGIVTTEGVTLHRPQATTDEAGALDQERESQTHALESSLEDRARAMLERVVGAGHVDVRATVDLDLARVEHAEDHYDPARTALRSEEQSTERNGGGPTPNTTLAGVPGAESNLPTGAARGAATTPGPTGSSAIVRETHTRNFEVDHVSDRRTTAAGTLRRVTMAVVVDGVSQRHGGGTVVVARPREELDRLASLVRSAIGASDARGDTVTVDCIPFVDADMALGGGSRAGTPVTTATPVERVWEFVRGSRNGRIAAGVAGALFVFASLWLVFALSRRRRRGSDLLVANATLEGRKLGAGPLEVRSIEPKKTLAELRAEAHRRAAADPATAALVVRAWLGTSTTDTKSAAAA